MAMIETIGFMAGALTTTSFLPQVIKSFKLKETKDISLTMYIAIGVGILLWLVYGLYLGALPIILANLVSFVLVLIILILKIRYG
jgi:MtN3 and saliva related transmembrane protein